MPSWLPVKVGWSRTCSSAGGATWLSYRGVIGRSQALANGFRFDAIHGCARFVPGDVADVLYGILDDASHHLLNELPTSPAFAQLRDDVERLRATDRRRRLGLLSGFRCEDLQPEERWRGDRGPISRQSPQRNR